MGKGGYRAGAGRPKGSKTKRRQARIEAIEASGLTPLEYLLMTLRDDTLERGVRLDAAKAAAPYVHPRLNAVDMKGELAARIIISTVDEQL